MSGIGNSWKRCSFFSRSGVQPSERGAIQGCLIKRPPWNLLNITALYGIEGFKWSPQLGPIRLRGSSPSGSEWKYSNRKFVSISCKKSHVGELTRWKCVNFPWLKMHRVNASFLEMVVKLISESCSIKPNLDCNYNFSKQLAPNKIPFGDKLVFFLNFLCILCIFSTSALFRCFDMEQRFNSRSMNSFIQLTLFYLFSWHYFIYFVDIILFLFEECFALYYIDGVYLLIS